jgi:hypothetical protein
MKKINKYKYEDLCLLGYNAVKSVDSQLTCSSNMVADVQWTTWRYFPEDRTLHNHQCENLKSYKYKYIQSVSRLYVITS